MHVGDGLAFLARGPLPADHAVVTSLPDVSEVSLEFEAWRTWFTEAAEASCAAVSDEAVAVFFQSDVVRDGRWVDKGALVHVAAERAGAHLLFHQIVCRAPAGTALRSGRPGYSHLLAYSRALRLDARSREPDVLPRLGKMTWARAMGTEVCSAVCRFLLRETACRVVVDPFCGVGTMLAAANAHGMAALGVELSPKRAALARKLELKP